MRATDWIALAGIGVALLSNLITLIVTRMTLRHNARQEDSRRRIEEHRWHVDHLRDTYASFAKSGWDWMTERCVFLQDDEAQASAEHAERERVLQERFEVAHGVIALMAPQAVWEAADEYHSAIMEIIRWIPGHGVPPELDQQVETAHHLYGNFMAVAREALGVPYDQTERLPDELMARRGEVPFEPACGSASRPA